MSVTDGWTDRRPGAARKSRAAPIGARSLKAALFEAGFGEAPPSRPVMPSTAPDRDSVPTQSQVNASELRAALNAPRVALFGEAPPSPRPVPPLGVVSPPPWLRAARRGRWHALMLNTFGWVMTLAVAGAIIGVAGRFLVVPPHGLESFTSARQ